MDAFFSSFFRAERKDNMGLGGIPHSMKWKKFLGFFLERTKNFWSFFKKDNQKILSILCHLPQLGTSGEHP